MRLIPDRKSAEESAIAGPELGYCVIVDVCYPNIRPIEGVIERVITDGEGALESTIAGSQFGYGVVPAVYHPNVASIESDTIWGCPHGEALERIRNIHSLRGS